MNLVEMCQQCNICHFMPEQLEPRVLQWHLGEIPETPAPVLVIDNAYTNDQRIKGCMGAKHLLREVPFTYTTTIRCSYEDPDMGDELLNQARASCSVWTRQLLVGRSLILSTRLGLKQMGIEEEKDLGSMFRSKAYGLVLCTPNMGWLLMSPESADTYYSHTRRLLKEAGL